MKKIKIIISADLLPTIHNEDLFSSGNMSELLGDELNEIIQQADFRIYNLEGPLIDTPSPIKKDGPIFDASVKTAKGLVAMKSDLILLANNHILDHGGHGVESTLSVLDSLKIPWIGVGLTQSQRSQVFYIRSSSLTIGVYNCCESEFSVVPEGQFGANAYNPMTVFDEIRFAKEKCDYLIVAYHGGKEKFRYPSPGLQDRFRLFAEKGADIVIAQHTHCVGCFEMYNGSLLVYGQGNFLFGQSMDEFCSNGLLIRLIFSSKGFSYDWIPVLKKQYGVRLANDFQSEQILSGFYYRSEKLLDENFIANEYRTLSMQAIDSYLLSLHGRTIFGRVCKKLALEKHYLNYIKKHCYDQQTLLCIYNSIRCEAHSELLQCGLESLIEKGELK
ncbi:MAG: CapA family protein [Lachnospiraceae bacterium]|nr:CapA family protein [Lachnospiraceae bacterium]